ncbi:hypothetical protein BDN70DRAFT_939310 [Pholiota conissans]|uniref:Uncharacterized protein n=1 Tax=Pholiota conissans TaxID=109636 RepID=A0A9P6CLR6_9AGAR|nr:hypothetical protein BDN70DRAFT_939310 [Pholiota conissans]
MNASVESASYAPSDSESAASTASNDSSFVVWGPPPTVFVELDFIQTKKTTTCRKIEVADSKPGEARFKFQTTTRTEKVAIETSASPPDIMFTKHKERSGSDDNHRGPAQAPSARNDAPAPANDASGPAPANNAPGPAPAPATDALAPAAGRSARWVRRQAILAPYFQPTRGFVPNRGFVPGRGGRGANTSVHGARGGAGKGKLASPFVLRNGRDGGRNASAGPSRKCSRSRSDADERRRKVIIISDSEGENAPHTPDNKLNSPKPRILVEDSEPENNADDEADSESCCGISDLCPLCVDLVY